MIHSIPVEMPESSRFYRLANRAFGQHFSTIGEIISDRRDIVQSAMLRLIVNMRRRPNDDWDRAAYACLLWGMRDAVRQMDPLSRGHRRDVCSGRLAAPQRVSVDFAEQEAIDTAELVSARQEASILWRSVEALPINQQKVMRALLEERTQREVAGELGLDESRVSQIKVAAFRTLRSRLRAQGVHR